MGKTIGGSTANKGRKFSLLQTVRTDYGAQTATYLMGTEVLPGRKSARPWGYNSLPSTAEENNFLLYTSTLQYAFIMYTQTNFLSPFTKYFWKKYHLIIDSVRKTNVKYFWKKYHLIIDSVRKTNFKYFWKKYHLIRDSVRKINVKYF
jgi:hypothetical protein